MNSTRISLPLAALVAALLFAVEGILELVHTQNDTFSTALDYAIEGAFGAALVAGAAALLELRDRGPKVPLTIAAAGHGALAIAAASTFVRGEDALGPIFMLGVLGVTAGFIATAVQDARGTLEPKRTGLALLVTWVASIALNSMLPVAAAWLLVAALATKPAARLQPATA